MSYCRWSSDNFQCDVYCYADVSGGYTTHVKDGKTYNDATPEQAADRLQELRNSGYKVPQYAIDELRSESNGE